MKYILMMQFSMADWKANNIGTWPPENVKANIDFLHRFHKELADNGELVGTQGLGGPEGMKVVRARAGGAPAVTDGPFPESKEFLAGYWIVDVDSPERACEIAGRLSALPGPRGGPANLPIEVRPVMGHQSEDW
jgi:hypothetical protein